MVESITDFDLKTTFDKEMRNISGKLGAKVSITEDSEMTDNEFLIKKWD